MRPLKTVAAYREELARIPRSGSLVTSFYATDDKLEHMVERDELFALTTCGVLFLLRRDRDFFHVSFAADRGAPLADAVRELAAAVEGTLTADLLGKREQVDELCGHFEAAGFAKHEVLHRMARPGGTPLPADRPDGPDRVVFAGPEDAAPLAKMLEDTLDRFTEQIPDVDTMSRAIAKRDVLVIRANDRIAGMLFFEVTGQSSLLRHWVVDTEFRDQRIGARLLRHYIDHCKDVRRFLLWVISNNDNAIDRYRHYGYERDGVVDQVLIRRTR